MSGARGSVYLAFDYGSQSIGVAAGSQSGGTATPLSVVRVFRSGPDWQSIDKLVDEWQPAAFVVGLALNAGDHTPVSRRAKAFGDQLAARYQRPVHWVDETLTTEAARQALRDAGARDERARPPGKARIDNTAAALILDSFLEAHR